MSNRSRLRAKRAKIARMRKMIVSEIPNASQPRDFLTSKVIDDAWRNILEQVVPSETGPELVKTMKRFFYAGAKCLVDTFLYTDCFDDNDGDLTKQELNRFDAIAHEVNAFFCDVEAGRQ